MPDPFLPDGGEPPLLSPPQVEDVFAATEQVRAADYPNVPAELLANVLAAEQENLDSRPSAVRAVGRAIDAFLADNPTDGAAMGEGA